MAGHRFGMALGHGGADTIVATVRQALAVRRMSAEAAAF